MKKEEILKEIDDLEMKSFILDMKDMWDEEDYKIMARYDEKINFLKKELERGEKMQENEVSDYEKKKAMNDLQREAFITKVLAELTVDLTVCKLMSDEPLKEWKIYLEKFKKEIDNLYERVSNK